MSCSGAQAAIREKPHLGVKGGPRENMAAHCYAFGGLNNPDINRFCAYLVNMHNDIQQFATKMAYYARIRTCRATLMRTMGFDIKREADAIQKAKSLMSPEDFLEWDKCQFTVAQLKEDELLMDTVRRVLDRNSTEGSYVCLRQCMVGYEEWGALNSVFTTISNGAIKDCKVCLLTR